MQLIAFVKRDHVVPIYVDTSYVACQTRAPIRPTNSFSKPSKNKWGLRVYDAPARLHPVRENAKHGLTMHTMHFPSEMLRVPGYGEQPKNLQLRPQEIKLAEQLIASLSQDFQPEQYHDTFQEKLRALVEAKQEGRTSWRRRRST